MNQVHLHHANFAVQMLGRRLGWFLLVQAARMHMPALARELLKRDIIATDTKGSHDICAFWGFSFSLGANACMHAMQPPVGYGKPFFDPEGYQKLAHDVSMCTALDTRWRWLVYCGRVQLRAREALLTVPNDAHQPHRLPNLFCACDDCGAADRRVTT